MTYERVSLIFKTSTICFFSEIMLWGPYNLMNGKYFRTQNKRDVK